MEFDLARKALSIHGDFFQQRCLSEVRRNWVVLAEEYPVSSTESYGSLDIWAALSQSGRGANLLIECKKSHPNYRSWVFLSKPSHENLYFPIVKMRKDSLTHDDPKIDPYRTKDLEGVGGFDDRGRRREPNIRTDFFDWDQKSLSIDAFAFAAHEIDLNREEGLLKSYEQANRMKQRPPHERIYHGCHQLSLAIKSIVLEELMLMEKRTYFEMPHQKVFIPILVTNADLVDCQVDAESIDLSAGDVCDESSVKFKHVDMVTYHFPAPKEFYLYPQDVTGDRHVQFLESASQMHRFKKLFILVVRPKNLGGLLQKIEAHARQLV